MQGDLVMLVTALMETDLARALKKDASMSGGRRITWEPRRGGRALRMGLARRIALDVARGLAFLHGRKVGSPRGFLGLVQQLPAFCCSQEKGIPRWCAGDWQVDQGDEWACICIKLHWGVAMQARTCVPASGYALRGHRAHKLLRYTQQ